MNRLAEICMLAHGWRRQLILILGGAVSALSMPPLFLLPLLFVGMPVWVWCLDGAERRRGFWGRMFGPAFSIGFAFGLGYFLVAIHWIGAAFFVDGGWVLAAMPFAVLALAAVLALFWGFASSFAHMLWSAGAMRVVALAVVLTIAEFARGHLLTGFPFDLLGYALTANAQMMQLASIIGIYGLTLLAALLAVLPALIWPRDERGLTRRLVPFFTIIVVLAGQIVWGQYRLDTTITAPIEGIKLRLVQPAIAQSVKWQADSREFVMERLLSLSETRLTPDDPGLAGVSQLIWPESAMPFYLAEQPDELARIGRMLAGDTVLVTGAPRREYGTGTPEASFNSILMINADGELVTRYDKTHLVPIGEYLPFKALFRQLGFTQFVPGAEGWSAGDSRRLMAGPVGPAFLPLICYEAIFSGDLGADITEAGYLLNLTNDGWFDGSIGGAQHFHHARLRAVEEGRALVRVANTGTTALVDPLGRITAMVQPGAVGVADVVPDQPLAMTLFAQYRHWPLMAVLLFGLLAVIVRRRFAGE